MQLDIGTDHRIVTDSYQYKLQKRRPATDKREEEYLTIGYYIDLKGATQGYLERGLRDSDAEGVVEVLAEIKRLGAALSEALTPKAE